MKGQGWMRGDLLTTSMRSSSAASAASAAGERGAGGASEWLASAKATDSQKACAPRRPFILSTACDQKGWSS
eukprot:scaffold217969_cov24-Tisochrysis_lutea.AAC.2